MTSCNYTSGAVAGWFILRRASQHERDVSGTTGHVADAATLARLCNPLPLASRSNIFYHKTLEFLCGGKRGFAGRHTVYPEHCEDNSVTILRVGTNQKYAQGWDSAFGGKKAAKASSA